jgi:FAD/FMN-containing dehydrogenase
VYAPLIAIGGSVSAEHGIGLEKKNWLNTSRTATELALMRQLKRTLDPKNLLNPGMVFDL